MKHFATMALLILASPVSAEVGTYQIAGTNTAGLSWRINTQTGQAAFCTNLNEVACFVESEAGEASDLGTYEVIPMFDFPAQAWKINTQTGAISLCNAMNGDVGCVSLPDK